MCVHVCVLFKRSVGASAPVWIFSTVEVLRFKLARSVDCKKRPSLDKASPANIGVLSWIYSILVESDQTFKLRQHGRNNQQRRKVVGGTTEEAVNLKKNVFCQLEGENRKRIFSKFSGPIRHGTLTHKLNVHGLSSTVSWSQRRKKEELGSELRLWQRFKSRRMCVESARKRMEDMDALLGAARPSQSTWNSLNPWLKVCARRSAFLSYLLSLRYFGWKHTWQWLENRPSFKTHFIEREYAGLFAVSLFLVITAMVSQ